MKPSNPNARALASFLASHVIVMHVGDKPAAAAAAPPATPAAAADATPPEAAKRFGALGWPLVLSTFYPGEYTLACPVCGSTKITLSSIAPPRGTGPRGRARMGDAGWRDVNRCNVCKHETIKGDT